MDCYEKALICGQSVPGCESIFSVQNNRFFIGKLCPGGPGTCDECSDPEFRVVDYDASGYVTDKTGVACVDKGTKVDGLYAPAAVDAKKFEACLTGCKKCVDGATCAECESVSGTPALFVDKSGSPHQCVECTQPEKYQHNGECLSCGTNCVECSDATSCTKCSNQATMSVKENTSPQECVVCSSLSDRYQEGGACKLCPPQCATCSSGTVCSSCKDINLYLNFDKLTCSTKCPTGEFEKNGAKVCEKCPNQCSDCNSTTACSGCSDANKYLQPDKITCENDCPVNFFKNPATMICEECPAGCSECLSHTECTKCSDSSHYLHQDKLTCSAQCLVQEYKDESTKLCMKCPVQCSDCSSATTCTGCSNPNHFLNIDKHTCSTSCPPGSKPKQGTKECEEVTCPEQCLACTPEDKCTRCKDSSLFLRSDQLTCSPDCPTGFVKNTDTMTCQPMSCPPQCHSCLEADKCTKCANSELFLQPDQKTCSNDCPKGTKKNEALKICELIECPSQCKSCSTPGKCDLCADPNLFLNLDQTTCSPTCPSGSVENSSTKKCDPTSCPEQCLSCTPENRCEACKIPSLFLQPDQLTCLGDCPSGYRTDETPLKCRLTTCEDRKDCK